MAICKHSTSKNGFAAALEYLTTQHDQKGTVLRNEDGSPVPRESYLINGINCIPETFAALCLQDRLRFGKVRDSKTVDTHQYILSFHPDDSRKGLTMEEAQRLGVALAKKNFPGHRVLVCTHPDGGKGSKNIHVHIVVSSLRFAECPPDDRYMRLRPDGSVKPSEYKAGCAHQDTAALRQHLLAQINGYCREHGYAVCPERAAEKVSQKEYLLRSQGVETRNDQLRRAIADAAQRSRYWDDFADKLKHDYTREVPRYPSIPYPERQKLWAEYRTVNDAFRKWNRMLRNSYQEQLDEAFRTLKACKTRTAKEPIRRKIAVLKENQAKERLYRQTWQLYARAAFAALRSHNQEDARLCLEQMQQMTARRAGCWQDGWAPNAGTHALADGAVKSKVTWKQITETERNLAAKTLQAVQEEARRRKAASGQRLEAPMPIEVKLHRGEISYRHPDAQRWIRGKRLGEDYTLKSLGIILPHTKQRHEQCRETEYVR